MMEANIQKAKKRARKIPDSLDRYFFFTAMMTLSLYTSYDKFSILDGIPYMGSASGAAYYSSCFRRFSIYSFKHSSADGANNYTTHISTSLNFVPIFTPDGSLYLRPDGLVVIGIGGGRLFA